SNRITHALHFEFSFQPQTLPLDAYGQHQHRLMDAPRFRIPRVNAAVYVDLAILTQHTQAKHSRNRRDSIVCESDHQADNSVALENPDKRRADAVADLAGHLVDRTREFFVVTQDVGGGLGVPTPKR